MYTFIVMVKNLRQNSRLVKVEFEDETPVNPFDFWEGRNFKLKIRQVEGGFRNYDKSEFESAPTPIGADEEIEAIWAKQHSCRDCRPI